MPTVAAQMPAFAHALRNHASVRQIADAAAMTTVTSSDVTPDPSVRASTGSAGAAFG